MNKKVIFLATAAIMLNIENLSAETTHLSEFTWGAPVANNRSLEAPVPDSGIPMANDTGNTNYCMQNCRGYSMTITECSAGYDLKSCEASNCGEYHKCEPNGCAPGYDTSLKDCPIDVQEDNYLCSKCLE